MNNDALEVTRFLWMLPGSTSHPSTLLLRREPRNKASKIVNIKVAHIISLPKWMVLAAHPTCKLPTFWLTNSSLLPDPPSTHQKKGGKSPINIMKMGTYLNTVIHTGTLHHDANKSVHIAHYFLPCYVIFPSRSSPAHNVGGQILCVFPQPTNLFEVGEHDCGMISAYYQP